MSRVCSFPSEGRYEIRESCSLVSEVRVENGRALAIVGVGSPTIDRAHGGGMHFIVSNKSRLSIEGVVIVNGNGVQVPAHVAGKAGGSILIEGSESVGRFVNCTFTSNAISFKYHGDGGAVAILNHAAGYFSRCTFTAVSQAESCGKRWRSLHAQWAYEF